MAWYGINTEKEKIKISLISKNGSYNTEKCDFVTKDVITCQQLLVCQTLVIDNIHILIS